METTRSETLVKGKTTSAKKIPYWLWIVIAKSLGIKLHPNDKPILSAILHIATFGSATALFCTNAWYCMYAVMSKHTRSDILDGTVSIMVMTFFCGLGVYSHRLAYRLFVHPKFLDMLRLHSKSVMKMNAAFLLFIILSSFVTVLNVATVNYSYGYNYNVSLFDENRDSPAPLSNATVLNPCQQVEIQVEICQIYWASQMIFSLFFLVWNLLVAVVLVSVARTQTINIRKFLRELEHDAFLLDRKIQASYGNGKPLKDDLKNFVWMDDDHIADIFDQDKNKLEEIKEDVREDRRSSSTSAQFTDLQLRLGSENVQVDESLPETYQGNTSRFQQLDSVIENAEASFTPHIMTEQEIMHKYWKISMNVRLASIALQRWMSSIVGMISAWSAIRMVFWLSHSPSWDGVVMFIVPLLLLPLLASSYAEVNYEGVKVIQSILPTEKRVQLFQYLYGQPIQMTVYGHAISYGTIGTVVAGILAAFASKILLQEMSAL